MYGFNRLIIMMIILSKWLNIYILLIDGTLTGTSTLDQSEPANNGICHTPQSSWTGASPLDVV